MSRKECIARRADESHLFSCPACRADARIAAAWKDLSFTEAPAGADERFVASVTAGIARDRGMRARRRWLAAAAAAALFAFFAGFAHERATDQAAPTAEESYASLAAPNALSSLMPN
jgi:predicted anti-sigma-YlaC factor YlaD